MKAVPVKLSQGRAYEIRVAAPLRKLGPALKPLISGRQVLVVSSPPIARLYAKALLRGLASAGFRARLALMPDGERHKNLDAVRNLYSACLAAKLDRKSALIALGGGVVGDAAGFAAATYMRGLPFVQCPTTLLAMVDSSIGGKTGVDLPQGKNLVGAFWQPKLVWADLEALRTLPAREWRTGMAEVIKYAFIKDASLLKLLEAASFARLKGESALLEHVVARSAAIKAAVVSRDERETKGLREILNLGHTFGHAIESVTGYKRYTHGEAIAIGMCAAARLSRLLGRFSVGQVARTENLLARWGLPIRAAKPLPLGKILSAMSRDKKAVSGRFRFIIPVAMSRAEATSDASVPMLREVLREVKILAGPARAKEGK